jgi:uncharacterized protein (TIGR03067 family)
MQIERAAPVHYDAPRFVIQTREGRMTQLCMVVVALAVSTGVYAQAGAKGAAAAKAAAAALQGTWILTTVNGEPLSEELALTIAGDKYHQTVGGAVNERGTIKIDTTKKPMTIDLVIAEGSDAGKTQLGIIEVTGDTIRGNLDRPGAAQRPTDFNIKDGAIMFVGKRKKT